MFNGLITFSDYVFSNNPYLINIKSSLENGGAATTVSGEGEFIGEDAFQQYKILKDIFLKGKSAWLRLPKAAPIKAKLTELNLMENARENMVSYSFSFEEVKEKYSEKIQVTYAEVKEEKSLWDIERIYGVSVSRIFELNPRLSSCYDILPGDKIRIA